MQLRNYEGSLEIKIWPKRSNRWASWRTITVYMSWLRVSLLAAITYPGVWKWNIENNLLYEDFIWTQSCFGSPISVISHSPYWPISSAGTAVHCKVALIHGIMGRRFPNGGLLRYRKWVPQQLGDVIVVTNSPPIGHMRSQLTNHQVGIILDVQAWSEKLY